MSQSKSTTDSVSQAAKEYSDTMCKHTVIGPPAQMKLVRQMISNAYMTGCIQGLAAARTGLSNPDMTIDEAIERIGEY